jgi:site-specific recombinase XerD
MNPTLSHLITRFFISYLANERDASKNTIAAYSDSIDTNSLIGLRDKALIQLLYNTGARVQEIADLRISDLRFENPATVTLTGKGRKIRTLPLWEETVQHIQAYLQAREHAGIHSDHLFLNNKREPITRFGIGRRVKLHANTAAEKCSELKEMKITPHVFRHTTALHLIETGSDITIVKEWLGHADLKTTSQYIEVSVARKRDALEKLPPPGSGEPVEMPEWKEPGIMEFLTSLSGKSKLCCDLPPLTATGGYSNACFAT